MRGAALNAAASDMVSASRGTSNQLAVSTKKFSLSYQDLLDSGMKLAGQAKVQFTFLWFSCNVPALELLLNTENKSCLFEYKP